VAQNSVDRSASIESRLGDGTATRAEQGGVAATHDNCNVDNKLLKEENVDGS